MSSARIGLIGVVALALNACAQNSSELPPANATASAPAPSPVTENIAASQPEPLPATPPETPAAPAVTSQVSTNAKAPAAQPASPQVAIRRDTTVVKTPIVIAPPAKAAPASEEALTLDLTSLETQLKKTKAIGLFSKIALKNQVDDLLKKFRDHYKGKNNISIAELHQSYDLLMMKVLSLLQDDDEKLASAIVASREAIWSLLADPIKFAALDA